MVNRLPNSSSWLELAPMGTNIVSTKASEPHEHEQEAARRCFRDGAPAVRYPETRLQLRLIRILPALEVARAAGNGEIADDAAGAALAGSGPGAQERVAAGVRVARRAERARARLR